MILSIAFSELVGKKENGEISWREYLGPLEFAHSFLHALKLLYKAL